MTPDLQREFRSLRESAEQNLRDVPASGSYQHLFSVWVRPSFAPSYRCTVYAPRRFTRGSMPFAAFTIWRSDLDLEKLRTPLERLKFSGALSPTMENDTLWLTEADVEDLQQRLCGLSVPIYPGPSRVAGCDGTSFEFHCNGVFHGVTIRWWENQPSEWQPFTAVVVAIAGELEGRRKNRIQQGAPPDDNLASASSP